MQIDRAGPTVLNISCGITTIAIMVAALTSFAAAAEPEAAFKARCGNCHAPRDVQSWGRQRADAAARQTWLEQFLRRHYPPPESERDLIIGYIQSTIAAQSAPR